MELTARRRPHMLFYANQTEVQKVQLVCVGNQNNNPLHRWPPGLWWVSSRRTCLVPKQKVGPWIRVDLVRGHFDNYCPGSVAVSWKKHGKFQCQNSSLEAQFPVEDTLIKFNFRQAFAKVYKAGLWSDHQNAWKNTSFLCVYFRELREYQLFQVENRTWRKLIHL